MSPPPYLPQAHQYTCSLAVLRMVLASCGLQVAEADLMARVEADYGKNFKTLWNPTIAKLAREYGIPTTTYARWPLFKADILAEALNDYRAHPNEMNIRKCENPNSTDVIAAPLSLSYAEMFRAIDLGCEVVYGGLTRDRLQRFLVAGKLVQTSIRTQKLYQGQRNTFHSLLLYGYENERVLYHDPAKGAAMSAPVIDVLRAANGTGAFMVFAPA